MMLLFFALVAICQGKQLDIHFGVNKEIGNAVFAVASFDPANKIDFEHAADPHVTLYLTDFEDKHEEKVLRAVHRVVVDFGVPCTVSLAKTLAASNPPYILWNVVNTPCIQRFSDEIVNATARFAKKNQKVPSWVYSLPEPARSLKIAMVKKYGSPNVFSQFEPHITVGYDTNANASSVYAKLKMPSQQLTYQARNIGVGRVGPYGTVLQSGQVGNFTIAKSGRSTKKKSSSSRLSRRRFDNPAKEVFDDSWDYFLLVREWPGTMAENPLPTYINTFTLHGMWPNRNDGSWPQFCNSSYPFVYAEIAPIISQLDIAWFDTMHGESNGTDFWSHEWDKHGTCAMSDSYCCGSERAFFQTAINLHNNMTEAVWLSNANIVPADPDQTTYSKDDFVNAIATGLGLAPLIRCTTLNGNNVIMDIGVCVDPNLNLISCPSNQQSTWDREAHCEDQIGYPTIPH